MEFLWVTMDLDSDNRLVYAGPSRQKAMRVAAALVGNNSYAGPSGDIYLYGPGDGSTSVIVRQLPKVGVENETKFGRVGLDLFRALEAVEADLHSGEDNFWRCGPWADPGTPEGEGGKVEMIRAALTKARS